MDDKQVIVILREGDDLTIQHCHRTIFARYITVSVE
jgi:hypothetical protein